jgi:hypothetical protein
LTDKFHFRSFHPMKRFKISTTGTLSSTKYSVVSLSVLFVL